MVNCVRVGWGMRTKWGNGITINGENKSNQEMIAMGIMVKIRMKCQKKNEIF